MKYKKIRTIQELKDACLLGQENTAEFVVLLGGGLLRSSKTILFDPDEKTFTVNNEIDDTTQEDLTEDKLHSETNIVIAMERGAFYQYIWE